jgi:hypothetical protein
MITSCFGLSSGGAPAGWIPRGPNRGVTLDACGAAQAISAEAMIRIWGGGIKCLFFARYEG